MTWVTESLRDWGAAKRRIECGGLECRNGAEGLERWHIDGWPTKSPVGRLLEARAGVATAREHRFPEVMRGEALQVSRALAGAPERLQRIAWAHYVVPKQTALVKQKAFALQYQSMRTYYRDVHRAHLWVERHWPRPVAQKNGFGANSQA